MKPIIWTLQDINEANNILAVLGKLPYEQVADTIARLKAQTEEQLKPKVPDAPPAA
jgi:hypothetical protein